MRPRFFGRLPPEWQRSTCRKHYRALEGKYRQPRLEGAYAGITQSAVRLLFTG